SPLTCFQPIPYPVSRGEPKETYLPVISLYNGTPFQPNSTLSTFSLQPPWTAWYHSGIAGRSLNRISWASLKIFAPSAGSVAARPSLSLLSNSSLEYWPSLEPAPVPNSGPRKLYSDG